MRKHSDITIATLNEFAEVIQIWSNWISFLNFHVVLLAKLFNVIDPELKEGCYRQIFLLLDFNLALQAGKF